MASSRGVWWFVLLVTLAGSVVFGVALMLRGPTPAAQTSTVLVWTVPDELSEGEPPRRPLGLGWLRRSQPTVFDVLRALDRASNDDDVKALVLHIDDLDWGWGRLSEIRDAVSRFRAKGKPVYAVMSSGGDAEYFLASAARTIVVPPSTLLRVDGLSASAMFMRGTLDKLDVHPNFVHAGEYKSGIEFYMRNDMSEPAEEALASLLDNTFDMMVDSLASARRLSRDSVLSLIDAGPFGARAARAAGLADTLLYADQLDSLAVRRAGDAEVVELRDYEPASLPRWGPHIAYVSAAGEISSGRSHYETGGGQVLGAETLIEALRDVRERHSVKAVVLRIDSPGGEVGASDEIWHEVRRLSRIKPVIVSMSDLAASGGYYIAAPASAIVAQPATITGSIGVYAGKLNVLGLYRKLGFNVQTVSRGLHAEMLSPFRDFTPDEAERFQAHIDEDYAQFLDRVAEGRHLGVADVDSVARGRVWSGQSAQQRALVDTLGGIRTAFRLAVRHAGLPSSTPFDMEEYPRVERSFFERTLQGWIDEDTDDTESRLAKLAPVIAAWVSASRFPVGRTLALLPWSIQLR